MRPRPPPRWLLAAFLLHRVSVGAAAGGIRDSRMRERRGKLSLPNSEGSRNPRYDEASRERFWNEPHEEPRGSRIMRERFRHRLQESSRDSERDESYRRRRVLKRQEAKQYHRRAEDEEEEQEDEEEEDDEEQEEEDEQEEEQEDEEEEDEEEEEDDEEEDDYVEDYEEEDDGYDEDFMAKLVKTLLGSGADISDYHLQFTTCTSVEGSPNKNYRSTTRGYRYAHHTYLHYHSCKNNDSGGYFRHFWGTLMCHRVSHVIRLDDFFQSTKRCVQDYCDECNSACDDEGSCNSKCLDRCDGYYEVTGGTMDYRGCAGPYNATDCNEYYFGPVCSQSGGVTKSYFLDDACEISAFSVESIRFDEAPSSLDVFKFVDDICTSCATGDVCEEVYDSSFHCSDRSMKAVAMGEGTAWQPDEDEDEDEGDRHSGSGDEERRRLEFADEVCYKTSTYNQKRQYQVHSSGGGTYKYQRAANVLMGIGILIMTVGSMGFLALSWRYHVRHSSKFGGESLCSDTDADSSVDESRRSAYEASAADESNRTLYVVSVSVDEGNRKVSPMEESHRTATPYDARADESDRTAYRAPVDEGGRTAYRAPVDEGGRTAYEAPADESDRTAYRATLDDRMARRRSVDESNRTANGEPADESDRTAYKTSANECDRGAYEAPADQSDLVAREAPVDESRRAAHEAPVDESNRTAYEASVDKGSRMAQEAPVDESDRTARKG